MSKSFAERLAEFNRNIDSSIAGLGGRTLGPEELSSGERWWFDRRDWLQSQGYLLRPRFSPAWRPSWVNNGKRWEECEDRPLLRFPHMLDAIRQSDNSLVMLKRIDTSVHPHEVEIARFFSSDEIASNPHNHCVPVVEVLLPPGTPEKAILVMPFLRSFDDPPFETLNDVVDFLRQVFEGLAFMHEMNVAHRDCTGSNIMLDPSALYPSSFHPVDQSKSRDFRTSARRFSRRQRPSKYYLTDFGISRRYAPEDRPLSEAIIYGADRSPPEHQPPATECDPFPTDIYYVGNMAKSDLLQEFKGLSFLQKLVDTMTNANPSARPTAEQVVETFDKICARLTERQKNARLARIHETTIGGFYRSLLHLARGFVLHFMATLRQLANKKD